MIQRTTLASEEASYSNDATVFFPRLLFELLRRIHNGKVNWLAYSVGWDARHVR
jgi:hypothetical protein